MDVKTRRTEVNLVTLGTGVTLFAIWSFVRILLTLFVFNNEIEAVVTPETRVTAYIIVGIVTGLICLNQLFIGLSARGEGKGKHKRIIYLIFDGIEIAISGFFLYMEFTMLLSPEEGILSAIASIIIEITSAVCLIEVMINSVRLRKIRKQSQPEAKGGAA